MSGRSTTVSISLGIALVAGRKRVPRPATGKTALRTGFILTPAISGSDQLLRRQIETVVLARLGPTEQLVDTLRTSDRRGSQQLFGGRRPGGHGRCNRHGIAGLWSQR